MSDEQGDDKVVRLVLAGPINDDQPDPVQSVVGRLEWYLEEAKAGRIRGYAIVVLLADGCVGHGYDRGDANVMHLLAGTVYLQRQVAAHEEP